MALIFGAREQKLKSERKRQQPQKQNAQFDTRRLTEIAQCLFFFSSLSLFLSPSRSEAYNWPNDLNGQCTSW